MRKLMVPLVMLCILVFSTETFAQCVTCRQGPVRRIVATQPLRNTTSRIADRIEYRQEYRQAMRESTGRIVVIRPLQNTANAVFGVIKGVGAVVRGTRYRIADRITGRIENRQEYRQARRYYR